MSRVIDADCKRAGKASAERHDVRREERHVQDWYMLNVSKTCADIGNGVGHGDERRL